MSTKNVLTPESIISELIKNGDPIQHIQNLDFLLAEVFIENEHLDRERRFELTETKKVLTELLHDVTRLVNEMPLFVNPVPSGTPLNESL